MQDRIVDLIGYAAGGVRMISFLPQIVKTLRTRRADDLSLQMLILNALTIALFIAYAVMKDLFPIVITLSILLGMLFLQIGLTLRFSSRKRN